MGSILADKRVCVTGGAGFLGRHVCARLQKEAVRELFVPRSAQFDLTREPDVRRLFETQRPHVVIHLAAEVGGIGANQRHPGRFFHANMAMGLHLIEASRIFGVDKFVQVGSVCAYPKHCPPPFHEDDLWNGYPEETNAPYGVAKRALGVMLSAYRQEYGMNGVYLIPTNLYGPEDNMDPHSSHVIPAMIRKFQEAVDHEHEAVVCWGRGTATREFLYVDDAADAIVTAANRYEDPTPLNLGGGEEIRMSDLAMQIAALCEFRGRIEWDKSQPDGQPRRRLDARRALQRLGWRPKVSLQEGLRRTVEWWRNAKSLVAERAGV
jgi:GDP-L-fucose synthase